MINQQNVDEIRLVDNETQQNPPSPKNNAVNYTLNESISFLPLLLVIVLFILIILLSAYQSVLPQLNKTLLILQIVTAITGIIVGSFAFYRIQQKLLSPLSGLNAWINRVSKGDLSARVDVPVGGELENIIRKINKLGESLKTQCQNMDNHVCFDNMVHRPGDIKRILKNSYPDIVRASRHGKGDLIPWRQRYHRLDVRGD